jgi:hypothetical protein
MFNSGFQHRYSGSKTWTGRAKVTNQSLVLFVKFAVARQERLAPHLRRKLPRQAQEAWSELMAVATALGNEVLSTMPIPQEVLKERYYDKIVDGCPILELELSQALADKNDKFNCSDLGTLNRIMQEHCGRNGVPINVSTNVLQGQILAIEQDSFNLMLRKCNYDVQAYKVWLGKNGNYECAVAAQKLDWARQARAQNAEAAQAFISQTMSLHALSKAKDITRAFNTFVALLESRLQLESTNAVVWPSLPSGLTKRCQAHECCGQQN